MVKDGTMNAWTFDLNMVLSAAAGRMSSYRRPLLERAHRLARGRVSLWLPDPVGLCRQHRSTACGAALVVGRTVTRISLAGVTQARKGSRRVSADLLQCEANASMSQKSELCP